MSPVEPVGGTLHEGVRPISAQRDSQDGQVGEAQPLRQVVGGQLLAPLPDRLEGHDAGALPHRVKSLSRAGAQISTAM